MTSRVVGFKELIEKLRRISFEAPVATAFGAYEGAQEIMLEAKQRAPKDTQALVNSGYVAPPEVRSGADVLVDMGFGGQSDDYVVRVHEDPDHAVTGEPFFFQNAIDANPDTIQNAIAKHVKRFLITGKTNPVPKLVPASPTEKGPDSPSRY